MSRKMSDESKPAYQAGTPASGPTAADGIPVKFHIGHVLSITALLAPIVGVIAPNGLSPLLMLAALAALAMKRSRDGAWPTPPVGLTILIVIAVGWAVLSAVWSINPSGTLGKLPRLALLLMAGLAVVDASVGLSTDQRRMVARYLAIGLAIGLVCMLIDRLTGGYVRQLITDQTLGKIAFLNHYNRPATLVVLFVWPLMVGAARIHILALVALWLLALGVVLSLNSAAAVLAIVLGGVGFVLVAPAPRIGRAAIAALIALSVLVAPALPPSQKQAVRFHETYAELPRSGYHRLLIWRFVADRILERPLLGWGFNASRDIPGKETLLDRSEKALPLHPHNAALQWWLELGALGAFLGAAVVIWLMRAIGRARASIIGKAAASGLVLSAVTVSFLSYGVWQSWWIAALWLSGSFMAALIQSEPAAVKSDQT